MTIALATCADLPDLTPDDRLLLETLRARGVEARPAVWDAVAVDSAPPDAWVIRSVWDYHRRLPEFLRWAAAAARSTTLLNALELVEWNANKRYLAELEARGIPVVDTVWATAPGEVRLREVADDRGWTTMLLKPAVGASAHGAVKVTVEELDAAQRLLDAQLARVEMMIQPYIQRVESQGELSLIVIAGEQTHAVRRPSALVRGLAAQRAAGAVEAPPHLRALAHQVLALLPQPPLYARVDIVDGPQPLLLELELIEPVLYFGCSRPARELFAEQLLSQLRLAA